MKSDNNSRHQIEFASQDKVSTHPELTQDFVRRVLEVDDAWLSDESSLWDFHMEGNNDALFSRIEQIYGVDVSDIHSGNISEILDRIVQTAS
jgi:hypothetical protein